MILALALSALCLMIAPGCLIPPAVLPAGKEELVVESLGYPDGTERVELEVAPGVVLRGIFCPSDEDAPVVLHLLESGASITDDRYRVEFQSEFGPFVAQLAAGPREALWQLADHGLASLVVDWEGVGASTGECSPTHLARDAAAMWAEAVRRAGAQDRVVLRGASIGSLAAALLLEDGARPARVVLVAPVDPRTVVRHFAAEIHGGLVAFLVAPFYRSVVDLDLAAALARATVPVLVYAAPGDELMPPNEQVGLRGALEAAGLHWIVEEGPPLGFSFNGQPVPFTQHLRLIMAARELLPGEANALAAVLPEGPPVRRRVARVLAALPEGIAARFAEGTAARSRLLALCARRFPAAPVMLALAALVRKDIDSGLLLLDLLRDYGEVWLEGLDIDGRVQRLSVEDPEGPLPAEPLARFARIFLGQRTHPRILNDRHSLDEVLDMARGIGAPGIEKAERGRVVRMTGGIESDSFTWDMRALLFEPIVQGRDLADGDAARQALRVLLKAASFEERLSRDADGAITLQAFDGEAWRTLDPSIVFEPVAEDAIAQ